MGHIIKLREYPDASFRDVTAPNADTLYTTAFFDVGKEPWVLSVPDMKDRYSLLPMLDGWTNVFQVPGKRTTGTGAADLRDHRAGLERHAARRRQAIQSPTDLVWLLGRIYCTGTPEDYAAVHALQDEFKLVPLSAYGKRLHAAAPARSIPSIDMKTAVRDQVNRDGCGGVLHAAGAADEDQSAVGGGCPGARQVRQDRARSRARTSTPSKLKADFAKRIPEIAFDRIMLQFKINKDVKDINGWGFTTKTGLYGTDYLMRALVTAIGLGRQPPAGRGLSDLAEGCRRHRPTTAPTST